VLAFETNRDDLGLKLVYSIHCWTLPRHTPSDLNSTVTRVRSTEFPRKQGAPKECAKRMRYFRVCFTAVERYLGSLPIVVVLASPQERRFTPGEASDHVQSAVVYILLQEVRERLREWAARLGVTRNRIIFRDARLASINWVPLLGRALTSLSLYNFRYFSLASSPYAAHLLLFSTSFQSVMYNLLIKTPLRQC